MLYAQYTPVVRAALIAMGAAGLAMPLMAQTAQSNDAKTTEKTLSTVTVVGTVDELQSLDFYAPNSSAVIRKDEIDAMGARKLDQALQYQAGVLSEPFGADNKVEWFKIRGFDASVSLDGTPTSPNGYFVWKPEVFGVESVEVLKGPNALVFGASETGGVVNLVTKRPQKQRALELNTEVGNNNRLGLSVDYNNIANSDGSVYYRLVAQARKEDGMQRETNMKSYYLAPSVTMEFTPRTSLTLLGSIQHENGRPTNGFRHQHPGCTRVRIEQADAMAVVTNHILSPDEIALIRAGLVLGSAVVGMACGTFGFVNQRLLPTIGMPAHKPFVA